MQFGDTFLSIISTSTAKHYLRVVDVTSNFCILHPCL